MFYRRKVLLSLLEVLGRPVAKVDLQKYLFMVCESQEKSSYEFVPHKFGCYSFQVDSDKRTLSKYSLIANDEKWVINSAERFHHLLSSTDQKIIYDVVSCYGKLKGRRLLKKVYLANPYYAINSEILNDVLSPEECEIVKAARPRPKSAKLFTIGYEGKSLEKYLQLLISNDVGMLCDVRRNPVSMKFGFSKKQLSSAARSMGIQYLHIPELGIESNKRKKLESEADYVKLFDAYRKNTLPLQKDAIDRIVGLIWTYKRVALTCFEANHEQCHRGCVSDAVGSIDSFSHRIAHL
jgi:hypothetical protein